MTSHDLQQMRLSFKRNKTIAVVTTREYGSQEYQLRIGRTRWGRFASKELAVAVKELVLK